MDLYNCPFLSPSSPPSAPSLRPPPTLYPQLTSLGIRAACVCDGLLLALKGGIVNPHLGVLRKLPESQRCIGVDVVPPPALFLSSLLQLFLVVLDPLHMDAAVWRFDEAALLPWTVHGSLPVAPALTVRLLCIPVCVGGDHLGPSRLYL